MNNLRNILAVIILVTVFACKNKNSEQASTESVDFLSVGDYDVGFKSIFPVDISRFEIPYSDSRGKLYPTQENSNGRSIPIHIWYPAKKGERQMIFEDYLNLVSVQSLKGDNLEQHSISRQVYTNLVNDLNDKERLTKDNLDEIMKLPGKACLNVEPIKSRFPLIVFPNGMSPANQSMMCEYLASYGYVVAALPLKGQFSHSIDVSAKGLEFAVDDLEFGLQQLLELPNVDGENIALLANAIEASYCAGLISRNEKIDALISLDGGFLSRFEQEILVKTEFYEPQSMTIPILSIYAPHYAISPKYIDDLKFSDRYFAHFPKMSEFHFLNFGVFEELIPGIIGEAKEDTKQGFKIAAQLILSFVDAKLKNKPTELEHIYANNSKDYDYESVIDSLYILKGQKAPPNVAILKNMFIENGMKSIDSVYYSHMNIGNKQPFSKTFYNDFMIWLSWKKDPKYINRMRLYKLATQSYPESVLVNYYYATFLVRTEQSEAAIPYYLKANESLTKDPAINEKLTKALKRAINKALDTIKI